MIVIRNKNYHIGILFVADINECTEDIHGCDPVRSNCTNTYGAFKCYCKPGYEKDALGQCKGKLGDCGKSCFVHLFVERLCLFCKCYDCNH